MLAPIHVWAPGVVHAIGSLIYPIGDPVLARRLFMVVSSNDDVRTSDLVEPNWSLVPTIGDTIQDPLFPTRKGLYTYLGIDGEDVDRTLETYTPGEEYGCPIIHGQDNGMRAGIALRFVAGDIGGGVIHAFTPHWYIDAYENPLAAIGTDWTVGIEERPVLYGDPFIGEFVFGGEHDRRVVDDADNLALDVEPAYFLRWMDMGVAEGATVQAYIDQVALGTIATEVGEAFEGELIRATPDTFGIPERLQIQAYVHNAGHAGETVLWTYSAGLNGDTFSIPLPGEILLARDYCWRVRMRDNRGTWTGWTARDSFTLASSAPVLSDPIPAPSGGFLGDELRHFNGMVFSAAYSDEPGNYPIKVEVRLKDYYSGGGFGIGDGSHTLLWVGRRKLHAREAPERVEIRYDGRELQAGQPAEWMMIVTNQRGLASELSDLPDNYMTLFVFAGQNETLLEQYQKMTVYEG